MTPAGPELGVRALNRALLQRQLLDERAPLTAHEAVTHLVALQAQAVGPPYLALWTRLAAFVFSDLEALLLDRSVVRTALLRSTLHLVTAEDCLALRPLLADHLARAARGQFGRQVADVDLAHLARLTTALVEEQPLTFAELGRRLGETWPGRDENALSQTARNLVPLVQVPPRGLWGDSTAARHTSVTAWLGRPLADDTSIDEHLLRYLAAYGPASVQDAQKWSGLTRLQAVVARLGPQLRTYRDDRGRPLLDLADRELPEADRPVPVRYLPDFDVVLLSHADRRRIVADEHVPRVFTSGGIIRATFLVDGFVAGRWRLEPVGAGVHLVVEPFTALSRATRTQLEEEGRALLAVAADGGPGDSEVRVEAPG